MIDEIKERLKNPEKEWESGAIGYSPYCKSKKITFQVRNTTCDLTELNYKDRTNYQIGFNERNKSYTATVATLDKPKEAALYVWSLPSDWEGTIQEDLKIIFGEENLRVVNLGAGNGHGAFDIQYG